MKSRSRITRKNIVGPLPQHARQSIVNVVQSGQLMRLTPVMWATLELKQRGVSDNLHVTTDIARQLFTSAYRLSIRDEGSHSLFARYNREEESWEPIGTMEMSDQQMFYNPMLCGDMVRQCKQLGFIDVSERHLVKRDCLLPLMRSGKQASAPLAYQDKFNALRLLAEHSPFTVPTFLKSYGIGPKKYARAVRYAFQGWYLEDNWDMIIDATDWIHFSSVSNELDEHRGEVASWFYKRIGLLT